MKSTTIHFPKVLLALCITLSAQTIFAQQNTIQFTPLQPVIGKLSFEYEHAINPKTTVMVEFQKWFEHRSTGLGTFLLGAPFSLDQTSDNHGFRLNLFLRRYFRESLHGGFVEGGFYFGQHNIHTTSTTTVLDPNDPIFWWQSSTEVKNFHPAIHGLRLGCGIHKAYKKGFSFEFSGGLSFNGVEGQSDPSFGMNPVSVYSRIALGLAF